MIKFVVSLSFIVSFSFGIFAQSGRKVTPAPTPTAKVEDPTQFSETKSNPKRPMRALPTLQGVNNTTILPPQNNGKAEDIVEDEAPIKVETNLITIPVSVFDRNGLYIPNIRQSEFKIFEDGVEQEIAYFGTTDKPFTVALLLDTSPSTAYRIDEIRAAAKAFVDQLKMQDRVMVIEFDRSIKVRCELTSDRAAIFKGIDKADFGDGTSIYDAVDRTLKKFLSQVEGRKAIVLFTDGVDTTSSKSTFDSTLAYAEESDVMIFPIYFNTFAENRRLSQQWPASNWPFPSVTRVGSGRTAQEYAVGKKYVEELADYTGGRVFRPESTPGGLTRAFEGIAEELRRQYSIGYVPEGNAKAGQRKQIKVRVDRPNLIVRSRDSYIVGVSK
jgi:Ca-activated chloride channel homolog